MAGASIDNFQMIFKFFVLMVTFVSSFRLHHNIAPIAKAFPSAWKAKTSAEFLFGIY